MVKSARDPNSEPASHGWRLESRAVQTAAARVAQKVCPYDGAEASVPRFVGQRSGSVAGKACSPCVCSRNVIREASKPLGFPEGRVTELRILSFQGEHS